jgi:hypothetical protein
VRHRFTVHVVADKPFGPHAGAADRRTMRRASLPRKVVSCISKHHLKKNPMSGHPSGQSPNAPKDDSANNLTNHTNQASN